MKVLVVVFNKEKALVGAISGHCKTSRRFVGSSTLQTVSWRVSVHYQKVIHRDIKPSNLLRADNGEVRTAAICIDISIQSTDISILPTDIHQGKDRGPGGQ